MIHINIFKYLIVPFLIGALLIGLWYKRSSNANFYFEVITDYAVFDLSDRWTIPLYDPLPLKTLYIENIDKEAFKEKNPFAVDIANKIEETKVYLSTLAICPDDQGEKTEQQSRNGTIELEADALSLNFFVKSACISGAYYKPEIGGVDIVHPTEGMPPETIRFKTRVSLSSPTRVTLSPDQQWIFYQMQIAKIQFGKEMPPGSGHFISRIKSGQLTVLGSKKVIDLGWADNLRIDQVTENRRMTIEKSLNGFKITFLGKAGILKAGPRGFEKDLRPRFLELCHNYAPLGLFIWAFTFLWSVFGYLRALRK
ncbi:MAG: hypothetical protein KAI50_00225 [Desulfobacterales bacterium]|nr:hypothetical protein [Desulfobacterales bacterium]